MSGEETRQVVLGFVGSLAGHWLAEDVTLYDCARSVQYRGRGVVTAWFSRFEPAAHRLDVIVDGGSAAVEMELRELSSGVSRATVAVYEVRGGEIVAARLYCASSGLVTGTRRTPSLRTEFGQEPWPARQQPNR